MTTTADSPLPHAVRLRPHHALLRRTRDTVQLGLGHDAGVEVTDLCPALLELLARMTVREHCPVPQLLAEAADLGAKEGTAESLLVELFNQGALLDADLARRRDAARRASTVLVEGAGPLITWIACGLATGGVGKLRVRTGGTVEAGEMGVLGVTERARSREAALPAAVRRIAPHTSVTIDKQRGRPDLAILTDAVQPDPLRHQDLIAERVPQLAVRLADGIGLVGPLVLAGRTACVRCVDLHRAAQDPCWPMVSADLSDSAGSATTATTAATAALAVEQALLALDALVAAEQPPPTLDTVLELDLRRARVKHRHWPPHPECTCGAAHTPSPKPAKDRPTRGPTTRPRDAEADEPPAACTEVAVR